MNADCIHFILSFFSSKRRYLEIKVKVKFLKSKFGKDFPKIHPVVKI